MRRDGLSSLGRLHLYTDLVLVSGAWLGAHATRRAFDSLFGYAINPLDVYLMALPAVVAAWVGSCWAFGLYRRARLRSAGSELGDLSRGVLLGLLVVSSIGYFFRELSFGRAVVLLTAAYSAMLQAGSRLLFASLEDRMRATGRLDVPALILGAGTTGIRLLQKIQDHPEVGYRVVGFLDDDPSLRETKVAGCPVLGPIEALRETIERHGVREVFVAAPGMGHTEMLGFVLACEDLDVHFRVVTNLFEVLTAGTQVDLVDDLPLVALGAPRVGAFYEPAKRLVDVAGAVLGLLLLAPLLVGCALRIRRDSPGPVLFVQERIGRGGRPFAMWKFRTMVCDTEAYAVAPSERDDPRITRFGRWLRRTSIDELPQLWNVLRGEMSLVGPRPEMRFIVDGYDEWQRRRLTVKPGITGLWQILGRKDLPMHRNLQYDFYYIRNRSLGLDLWLLLRTVGVVLSRRGAY